MNCTSTGAVCPVPRRAPGARAAVLLAVIAAPLACHHHDHPTADPAAEEGPDPLQATVFAERIALFVEYPRPVAGEPIEALAHLTHRDTGRPVTEGVVTLEAAGATGEPLRARVDGPRRPGLFVPSLTIPSAGTVRLAVVLDGPDAARFDLGEVRVHPDSASAAAEADAASGDDEIADAVPFLLEEQWKIGMLLHRIGREDLVTRVQAPGRVIPRHGSAAHVTPPVAGSVESPEGGLPDLGDRVERGQLLAWLRPPLPPTEAAQLLANRVGVETQRRELRLKRSELDVRLAEIAAAERAADAREDYLRRARERAQALAEKGLATEQEVDDAARDLDVAAGEREGRALLVQELRAARDEVSALLAAIDARPSAEGERLPLYAPISGIVLQAECIEGQFFEAAQTVFELLDASTVWVEARVPEFDLPAIGPSASALLRVPGHESFLLDLSAVEGAHLVHVAPVVDPETHAAPLRFEVPNQEQRLRVGMSVDVFLEAGAARAALAIPRESVVIESGRPTAYVLVSGEMFQKRFVDLGIEDGDRVEVRGGLAEGERVVARGAYTLRLSSLAPDSVAEGHHHH